MNITKTFFNLFSQTFYEELRRGFLSPGYNYFYVYVGLFVFLAGIIIVIFIYRNKKCKTFEHYFDEEIKHFEDRCHEKNMSNKEINLLKSGFEYAKIKHPVEILENRVKLLHFCDQILKKFELKYIKNSKELVQIHEMVKHILKQYEYEKPDKSSALQFSKDLRAGQKIVIFQRTFLTIKPVIGSIVYLDDFLFAGFFTEPVEELQRIETETKIDITFNRENDAQYFFSSRVLQVNQRETGGTPGYIVVLQHSNKLYRTQKRHFIRLEISKPVIIYPNLLDKKKPEPGLDTALSGTIIDISEGGVCIECVKPLPPGISIKLDFTLIVDYKGIVAELVATNKKRDYYQLHLKFYGMEQELRDNIRKYILTRTSSSLF